MKVNNSFPTNYPCIQAVHYKDNRSVVIFISYYLKTFKMSVVSLHRICLHFAKATYNISSLAQSGRTVKYVRNKLSEIFAINV